MGLQALLIDLDRIAQAAILAEFAVRHGLHHADGGHEGVIECVRQVVYRCHGNMGLQFFEPIVGVLSLEDLVKHLG